MSEISQFSGMWRIPATEETYQGDLIIDNEKRTITLILILLADEKNPIPTIKAIGKTDIITGNLLLGGYITLYGCDIGGSHTKFLYRTEVPIRIQYAFWGLKDVDNSSKLCFKTICLDFGEIVGWSNLCSYEWEMDDSSGSLKYQLKWNHKEDLSFQINDDLKIRFSAKIGERAVCSTDTETLLRQRVDVLLEYNQDEEWSNIPNDIEKINSLIILGMHTPVYLKGIYFFHSIQEARHEIVIGTGNSGITKRTHPYEYFFTLNDLFEKQSLAIKSWFEKYDLLKPVVELYEVPFLYSKISVNTVFLNLVQALETYHARFISDHYTEYSQLISHIINDTYDLEYQRDYPEHINFYKGIMLNPEDVHRKQISLRSRLGYLFIAKFKIVFCTLHYSMGDFIQKIVDTRNYFTHYDPIKEEKTFCKSDMPYVNSTLMCVLEYYILSELNLNQKLIEEKVKQHMRNIEINYERRECK